MEAVIFIGVQASGKSTFYKERFLDSHIRINLDMLKTRYREQILINACLEGKQPFVVDNTNPTPDVRQQYIQAAQIHKFRVIGYYFSSVLEDCKRRNQERDAQKLVPLPGLISTYKQLALPSFDEGFDKLYFVRIDEEKKFIVEDWSNEI